MAITCVLSGRHTWSSRDKLADFIFLDVLDNCDVEIWLTGLITAMVSAHMPGVRHGQDVYRGLHHETRG